MCSKKSNGNFPSIILISEQSQETAKYMLSLALNIPCLHSSWLSTSIEKDELEPIDSYTLDLGYSLISKSIIP